MVGRGTLESGLVPQSVAPGKEDMANEPSPPSSTRSPDEGPSDRLDSWKDIAAYLKRDVSTVQRWEKREGMPVHRHQHDKLGSVYAFRSEIDAWWQSRSLHLEEKTAERKRRPSTSHQSDRKMAKRRAQSRRSARILKREEEERLGRGGSWSPA